MPNDPQRRVAARLTRWLGRSIRSRIVVAVSGGGDSVALLRLLHAAVPGSGDRLVVAHMDHGVRGDDARADAAFVAELAGTLQLPCVLGRWSPRRSHHFESDARAARYAWLREVAAEHQARAVAVGHTRDDQAETVLFRVLRGTGLRGLAGMPSRRVLGPGVHLIRPVLGETREELRRYLDSIGQAYREDASNAGVDRSRARIRNDLLPRLAEEYNPRVVDALARLGRLARQADHAARRQADAQLAAVSLGTDEREIRLDRAALATMPAYEAAEVLRLAWRRAGWPEREMSWKRWRRLVVLTRRRSGRVSIGHGVDAVAAGDRFRLVRGGPGCD